MSFFNARQIALHPLRRVEKAVLQHVGSIDSTIRPCIRAKLDHRSQPVAVPLEQVGQHPPILGFEPPEQVGVSLGEFVCYGLSMMLSVRMGGDGVVTRSMRLWRPGPAQGVVGFPGRTCASKKPERCARRSKRPTRANRVLDASVSSDEWH